MAHVSVPEVFIAVKVDGDEVARFAFNRTVSNPQEWDISAALNHPDARSAVRSILLTCVAELTEGSWEPYSFVSEGGNETNDQPQLPFSHG